MKDRTNSRRLSADGWQMLGVCVGLLAFLGLIVFMLTPVGATWLAERRQGTSNGTRLLLALPLLAISVSFFVSWYVRREEDRNRSRAKAMEPQVQTSSAVVPGATGVWRRDPETGKITNLRLAEVRVEKARH